MSAGKPNTRMSVPARNESTVRLSNIRPKKPFTSPSDSHWYLFEDLSMSVPSRGGKRGQGYPDSRRQAISRKIDGEVTVPPVSAAPIRFDALGLADGLVKAVTALGYEEPTPIQREAIPLLLAGRD